jgi:hypothetical protein
VFQYEPARNARSVPFVRATGATDCREASLDGRLAEAGASAVAVEATRAALRRAAAAYDGRRDEVGGITGSWLRG